MTSPIIPEIPLPMQVAKMARLRQDVAQAKWQPDPNTRARLLTEAVDQMAEVLQMLVIIVADDHEEQQP